MSRFFQKVAAEVWIILIWAVAAIPNLSVRSFIWEEGTNAVLARDILVYGNFFDPMLFGIRDAEKPSLLSWLIAGTARLTGEVNEWSARLPVMIASLLTALLVLRLTRRYAGATAGFFAAMFFLFSPMVLRKLMIAEPDTIVTFFSFAAFVVWWRGEEIALGTWRWLVCGLLLATAALAKGPQPIAFFTFGAGCFVVRRQKWGELPGLVCCLAMPALAVIAWGFIVYRPEYVDVWSGYMRLHTLDHHFHAWSYLRERFRFSSIMLVDLLPGILLLPFAVRHWARREPEGSHALVEALLWYAGVTALALFFWPGANTRYVMPAVPAVAVIVGLALPQLWKQHRRAVQAAFVCCGALVMYQIAFVWVVMPAYHDRFGASRAAGQAIDRAITRNPAPVYVFCGPNSDQLFYVSHPIQQYDFSKIAAIRPPAWLLMPAVFIALLHQQYPDMVIDHAVETESGQKIAALRFARYATP
jgi:4-amino-4-deoxy-L-arabinose transferase-like glycosyltransferase